MQQEVSKQTWNSRIHHMVRLQTNGHVNGFGDYGKGGKSDYEKIG